MRRGVVGGALCVAGLALGTYHAARQIIQPARGVLLVTVDTLRADRTSAYGYAKPTTPTLDRLSDAGALFTRAYCDVPWTTGSMASVMTGTYGPTHGLELPWQRLPAARTTLAEILHGKGFATAAVIGSYPVTRVYGLDQGFAWYDDKLSAPQIVDPNATIRKVAIRLSGSLDEHHRSTMEKMHNDAYRPDEEVTDAAIRWLAHRPPGRFFLWVHYFGPHERILLGRPHERDRILRDYDRDVGRADAAVGRLLGALATLGLATDTLVVFHSDHGQALGEHGIIGHGRDLHEASVRVPLIMRLPGVIEPGTRVAAIVRTIDLLPTILDFLDVPPPRGIEGRSLRPLLDGERAEERPAFMRIAVTPAIPVAIPGVGTFFGPTSAYGVREGRWKYVRTVLAGPCERDARDYSRGILGINPASANGATRVPEDECRTHGVEALYDVEADGAPGLESANHAADHPEVTDRLRALAEGIAANKGRAEAFALTTEQEAKLRSLGYLE